MSDLLNIYQDNINIIHNKITKLLNIFTNLNVEKFDLHCKDIDINIKESERMLKQIELELTTNILTLNNSKVIYKKNFQNYKNKHETFKKIYFQEKEKFNYTKKIDDMILKEKIIDNSHYNSELSQTQKFLDKEKLLVSSNDKIQLAKLKALQIDNTGKNITIDLENQSKQLNSLQLKMQDLNVNLVNANNLITKMFDRENRSKLLIATFGAFLFSIMFLILNSKI